MKYLILALLAAALALPAAAQQQFTFKFNPPDGTKVTQTDDITITQQSSPTDKNTRTAQQKTTVAFHTIAKGFTMALTNVPAAGAKKSETLTLVLDGGGNLQTIQELPALRKEMTAKLTPTTRKNGIDEKYVDKVLDRLVSQQKAMCKQYFGLYAGKTVKVGDVWKDSTDIDIDQSVSVTVRRTITFAGTVQKAGKTCLRVKYSVVADEKTLQAAVNKMMAARDKLAKAQGEDPKKLPRIIDMSMKEEGERIVDPTVMLDYGETVTATRTQRVSMPGKGTMTATVTQKKVSTMTYGK